MTDAEIKAAFVQRFSQWLKNYEIRVREVVAQARTVEMTAEAHRPKPS